MALTACAPARKLEEDCYDWYARHGEKCAEAARGNHDIVMIGDSITHFWEDRNGPEVWKRLFAGRSVLNLGFGWDRTGNVLWRLANGEFAGQSPRAVVVNLGTNNLNATPNYPGDTPAQTAVGVLAVVDKVRALAPAAAVAVMGVFQRGTNAEPHRARIRELNVRLPRVLSCRPGVEFIDISERFLGPDGDIDSSLFVGDNCHPAAPGYEIWAAAIDPFFRRLGL